MIRIGPAGWTYPDSPGHVYPAGLPKSFDVLAYLARFFDTIEINASFYAPQPPRNYASWAKRVAGNAAFRFTAKLWQRFTHGALGARGSGLGARGKSWTAEDVRSVTEGFEILHGEGRLGAILAQFPHSFKHQTSSVELLERLADDFHGWPVVVEFRHGSWATRDTSLLLQRLGLGFCNIDQPQIGDALPPSAGATSDIGYIRFHGRNYEHWFSERDERDRAASAQRYNYLYSAAEHEPWAERVRKVASAVGVADVYVVANNHFEGKGPANALMLRAMIDGRKVAAPPVLRDAHPALQPWSVPGTG